MLQSRLILMRRSTVSWRTYPPSFRSISRSTPIGLSWNLWAMPLLQMTPIVLIRKARRRRLWQPPRAVLLTSIGWWLLHITTHHSSSIISWLSIHRCIRRSCLELRRPHRACCTHHRRRRRVWFHAHAKIVVMLVISPRSVRHRGRVMHINFRVIPIINRELLLPRSAK
jgi:hypothetical protein